MLAIADKLCKEIPQEMRSWVKIVDDQPRCDICKKVATEGH